MASENPMPIKPEDVELWNHLIHDAEPLPNPKRGLFKFRELNLRMPKRGSDGISTILTERGEVFFQGPLIGVLLGAESRLVQTLNKKVQEIQIRASSRQISKSKIVDTSLCDKDMRLESPKSHRMASIGNQGPWREITSAFNNMDLERRIQQLDIEEVLPEDSISDPDGTSVTATVVKAEKSELASHFMPAHESNITNVVSGYEFDVRSKTILSGHTKKEPVLETRDCHKEPIELPMAAISSGPRVICNEQIKNPAENLRPMRILHDFVTVQGNKLQEGRKVYLVAKGERGWAHVVEESGIKSWVPFSYLEDFRVLGAVDVRPCPLTTITEVQLLAQDTAETNNAPSPRSGLRSGSESEADTEKIKLMQRVQQLENSANIQLVLELQRELQRERQERDAERKALESDILRSKEELRHRKEDLRLLEARLTKTGMRTLRDAWCHASTQTNANAIASSTTTSSDNVSTASELGKLTRALQDELARGAAWQETTEELMVQNERLRICIQEQQAALQERDAQVERLTMLLEAVPPGGVRMVMGRGVDGSAWTPEHASLVHGDEGAHGLYLREEAGSTDLSLPVQLRGHLGSMSEHLDFAVETTKSLNAVPTETCIVRDLAGHVCNGKSVSDAVEMCLPPTSASPTEVPFEYERWTAIRSCDVGDYLADGSGYTRVDGSLQRNKQTGNEVYHSQSALPECKVYSKSIDMRQNIWPKIQKYIEQQPLKPSHSSSVRELLSTTISAEMFPNPKAKELSSCRSPKPNSPTLDNSLPHKLSTPSFSHSQADLGWKYASDTVDCWSGVEGTGHLALGTPTISQVNLWPGGPLGPKLVSPTSPGLSPLLPKGQFV